VILLAGGAASAAERIKVVATFSVIGDMVANVAGDKVDLVTLVGFTRSGRSRVPSWESQIA